MHEVRTMNKTKRRFTYRHADGRTESIACEWDDDAEFFKGFTDDNMRVYFESDGTQLG